MKYGDSNTYPHPILTKEQLDRVVKRTNRSKGQTEFLHQLVGGSLDKLLELEFALRHTKYRSMCPDSTEEVQMVLDECPVSKQCEHKYTGSLGKIVHILSCSKELTHPQYGIFWQSGQKSIPSYWNNMQHIKILN